MTSSRPLIIGAGRFGGVKRLPDRRTGGEEDLCPTDHTAAALRGRARRGAVRPPPSPLRSRPWSRAAEDRDPIAPSVPASAPQAKAPQGRVRQGRAAAGQGRAAARGRAAAAARRKPAPPTPAEPSLPRRRRAVPRKPQGVPQGTGDANQKNRALSQQARAEAAVGAERHGQDGYDAAEVSKAAGLARSLDLQPGQCRGGPGRHPPRPCRRPSACPGRRVGGGLRPARVGALPSPN